MAVPVSFARAAGALLGSERGRKALGWVVVALCSPFIVLIAFLCALGSGMAQHNAQVVTMCFSDGALPSSLPTEYRTDILKARSSFGKIDDAIEDVTEQIEDAGLTLDDKRIKAVFLSLYFGENSPSKRDIREFVDCFVVYEQRTRTVTVEVPMDDSSAEDSGVSGGVGSGGSSNSSADSGTGDHVTNGSQNGAASGSAGNGHSGNTGSHTGANGAGNGVGGASGASGNNIGSSATGGDTDGGTSSGTGGNSTASTGAADSTDTASSAPITQTVTTTQTYTAAVPIEDMAVVYANIGDLLGAALTAQQQANAERIYSLICNGYAVGSGFAGADTVFMGANGFCSPIGTNWRSVVSSGFGGRTDPFTGQAVGHTGLDLAVPTGTPVRAALPGTVVAAQYNAGGYGYYVKIDHGNGLVTLYGHCSQLTVSAGQTVAAGDVVALSGSTGRSTGPHLHFEVRVNGEYADPEKYLP